MDVFETDFDSDEIDENKVANRKDFSFIVTNEHYRMWDTFANLLKSALEFANMELDRTDIEIDVEKEEKEVKE